jgi:SPP1 family predicted phage head-tail adaptor
MGAGEFDQRISFESRAPGEDELGQPNGAWAAVFSCWAKIVQEDAGEAFAEGQMQARTPATFYIRFRADINVAMRINWKGSYFEMVGEPIDSTGGRHTLAVVCVKGVRDGR